MKTTMKIDGMMCMHCVGRVNDVLNGLDGVSAEVSLQDKAAYLNIDGRDVEEAMAEAVKAVTDAGYTVVSAGSSDAMKAVMHIDGMMCMHCVGRVSDVLNGLDGITAKVELNDKAAYLEIDGLDYEEAVAAAQKAVTDAGYTVTGTERG